MPRSAHLNAPHFFMGVFWDLLLATYHSTSKNVNMIHQLIKTISKILQTIQQCARFGLGWNLQEPGLLLMSWLLVSPPQVATQSASVSSSLVRIPLSDDICCTTREALSRHSSCLRWTTHLVLLVLSHAFLYI
jgi:hypothetical protein